MEIAMNQDFYGVTRRSLIFRLLAVGVILVGILACTREPARNEGHSPGNSTLRIGHDGSPLLGPLYLAAPAAHGASAAPWELVRFGSGGDLGYALLAGKIGAGFVETNKAVKLLQAPGGADLKVAGAIQFPYGATLVLRKDLSLRLTDLAGHSIAAQEPDCKLLHRFRQDVRKSGVNPDGLNVKYMPFDEMIPALEAKAVDAVLVKGAYAVLAQQLGHKILYQKWDIQAGDDCCPAALAQTELLLVVRNREAAAYQPLVRQLAAASLRPPAELRQAVARQVGYPLEALQQFPLSGFTVITDELGKILGEKQCVRFK
jgi:ABC-type nitrate/sulfonate/bicarbonate transport system substrate-binding protein